ncbi:hypothetical protein [Methylocapsa palsarum]|uniref:LPXTG-motif cell wall anchor domain-containing protein n=1 Tax=Methylocapsa palsarum TaxID=1612308 RepID=A0A1I3Y694_9HYPH|nr:hypothetical protein [Methylocapsa palsarum]SFK27292.1 hypothetical protein SAMN05444581_10532 [Methylocapsa palsarum]
MKIFRLMGACGIATLMLMAQASAHGGVSVQENKCIMKIGPYFLSFTGYQPQNTYSQFCDDIPDRGKTVIVLDAEQSSAGTGASGAANSNELRDMMIDFRVLKNVGQAKDEDDMEKNTEVYLQPKKYPSGTLTFQHDFEKGNFIGLVTATNDHGQVFVSRFPFAVGATGGNLIWSYIIGGVALVGAAAAYFLFGRKSA